jgi:hypothetical protein
MTIPHTSFVRGGVGQANSFSVKAASAIIASTKRARTTFFHFSAEENTVLHFILNTRIVQTPG